MMIKFIRKRKRQILNTCLLLMISVSCRKDDNAITDLLIFPIGRSFLDNNATDIKLDCKTCDSFFLFDNCGGYWLEIPKAAIPENDDIIITITRKTAGLKLFSESDGFKKSWINPSYYIDSDNEKIKLKATELTTGITSKIEKAKIIQQFVISHMHLNIYKDSFLSRASETYESGYGTCINFSRLYVALCRASGIPARTIWGIVYGHENDNIFDYHHQWAEILDDSGYWHPVDFNYTTSFDLNDIRYVDLIYAAEENTIVRNRNLYEIMLKNVKYFNDYPATLSGRLGFALISDNRPDSMVVRYSYLK